MMLAGRLAFQVLTSDDDGAQQFLRDNGLKLVVRSHEGPDARVDRDDMPPMTSGHSTDHVTESELPVEQVFIMYWRLSGPAR